MTTVSTPSLKTQSFTHQWVAFAIMVLVLVIAPIWVYPIFLMKVMCFALFACAFNLLIGFGGLLSFGHAMFLGTAGYAAAHAAKVWGWNPELAVLFATAVTPRPGAVAAWQPGRKAGARAIGWGVAGATSWMCWA